MLPVPLYRGLMWLLIVLYRFDSSPVGVMILARGDLNINDGEFTPGIKIPNCRRYFNLYHPIDPIAYRIEPLIKQEMHDKEPVQLMQVLEKLKLTYWLTCDSSPDR